MQEEIIGFLKKKDGYVSGDHIAQRLGISRQALWKHIQELKEDGFDIVAVPHLGYRLESSPDRLFDFEVLSGLNTKFVGKKIYYFDSLSSTMDEAMRLGIDGAEDGVLVLAESQTKGKGRLGRPWASPKYKGIYLSLILRPNILPVQAPILTLLAAVSACEAIKENTGIEPKIKWPNDIIVNNKKLAGILTELNAETDEVRFVVIGIGLNVNNDEKSLPAGATSLRQHKNESLNRVSLLQALLRKIEENYLSFQKKGPRSIIDKWRENSVTLGERVKVDCKSQHIEGHAADIDTDGGLLIRLDSGITKKVMTGDVVHCK
jgi:BirA family biotin operon repressor/biotin-[acetyl-CoA-carboxylase] ligase